MVKIESLNLNDLKFLAKKVLIEDVDDLTQQELMAMLKEEFTSYYDDDTFDANEKYISSLYVQDSTHLAEYSRLNYELVPTYNETIIQIISKNPSWIYSYWSISSSDLEKYSEVYDNASLVINVKINGDKNTYDYDVSIMKDDKSWLFNLPDTGGTCKVYLVLITQEGARIVLAESNKLDLFESYWLNHKDDIKDNAVILRDLYSPILLESGVTAYSLPLKKLLQTASDEGVF